MKQLVELHESTEGIWYDEKSRAIILTPDDILTLKLLRDDCRVAYSRWPDEKHRRLDDVKLLETLERILKQAG